MSPKITFFGRASGKRLSCSALSRRDRDRLFRSLPLLQAILIAEPKSVYQLAAHLKQDVANVTKTVSFLRRIKVLRVQPGLRNGRSVSRPVMAFDALLVELDAAEEKAKPRHILRSLRRRG